MWDDNCVGYAKTCPMVEIFAVTTPAGVFCGSNQPGFFVSNIWLIYWNYDKCLFFEVDLM